MMLKPPRYDNVEYDYKGHVLKMDSEGCYSDIPERCPECNSIQSVPNYQEYTNQTVHICEQCGTEMNLQY